MEELFGISMSKIMLVMVAIFVPCIVVVAVFAARNRIMLKLGLRNLPRRRGQTALSLMGIMLSTVIIAAALGTGDTISYSIRNETVEALGNIDEIIVSTRAGEDEQFGRQAYVPIERFDALRAQLAGDERIDGLAAQLAESAPTVNTRTSLSEGRMRVVGIDSEHMAGFRDFTLISGGVAQLSELADDEAYVNDRAAEELDAVAGDKLRVFQGEDWFLSFRVKGVVNRGGLAGRDPTMLLPLARAQALFDRAGQVNLFVVSNRGDAVAGAELSEDVTKKLRVLFTDAEVVARLRDVLTGDAALSALNEKLEELKDARKEEFGKLIKELATGPPSEELINLLADDQVSDEVLDALDVEEHKELQREVISQLVDIGEFRVISVKHRALSDADEAGSGVTGFFMIMGLFSIMVGVLLIFLIFVMLAAARRSEMGMARAVGAKRRHLVQMFVFEGTAYALVSAAIGVVLGLLVSGLMVEVINRVFASVEESFQMTRHFEIRSVVVAYTLGMVITFGTVIFSAVRVSRLNIVVAIRGLPDALVISPEPPFLLRFSGFLRALFRPLVFLASSGRSLWRRRWMDSLRGLALAVVWILPPLWIGDIVAGLLRFVWPYLLRGWLTIGIGAGFMAWGVSAKLGAPFAAGVSVVILGLGLGTRKLLQYTSFHEHLRDRAAFSATGIAMLLYWALPSDIFKGITGELERDFEMMFISGIFMVTAAVFTILYNANLLVSALVFATGRVGKLRPVLVTAIAYPMSARFRTGLTLAMFALVIFTLMVMSVLTESFSASFSGDAEMIVGGWDIEGVSSLATPIEDIRQSIDLEPSLQIDDFTAIGGYTRIGVQARQVGGENQRWRSYRIRAANDEFLDNPGFKLKLIADGYGSTDSEAWQALKADPSLVIVEAPIVPTKANADQDWPPFTLEGVHYDDESMAPIEIEVREPRTGVEMRLTVIGVLDNIHAADEDLQGMFVSKSAVAAAVPFPIPLTTYLFRLRDGADPGLTAKAVEAAFLEHGMEAEGLVERVNRGIGAFKTFIRIFVGFMGLGLVVGVAALGVVSTRAVVERRQQIGVLRAIGYKRRMIQMSFLLESSFVSLLGTIIGVVLGLTLSYNAINDIRAQEATDTLRFTVPWVQIAAIVAVTYVFSLLTTYLPARQASRIYPAEALRYE